MNHNQLKNILRNAVIAAIPATAAVSCVPAETVKPPVKQAKPAHPCGTPESKPVERTITANKYSEGKPLTAEQCLALCKSTAESERKRYNPTAQLIEHENFNVQQCNASADVHPEVNVINCKVAYTELKYPVSTKPGCFIPRPRPVVGRMPVGMQTDNTDIVTNSLIGEYFADMAMMEKAAITAFQYLVRELEAYEAPQELVQLARQAIAEEARHTKMASDLSKSYDTDVPSFTVDDFKLRSLFEIALENAVEGCVNESFAAACGLWQHAHAKHEVFRQVIGHISEEEIGHGALSWSIHEWIMPQLTEAQQMHVTQAQITAFNKLEETFTLEEHPAVRRELGLPNQTEAFALIQSFRNQVLS